MIPKDISANDIEPIYDMIDYLNLSMFGAH